MSFEGKVVAITGAASGIALALTKLLASRGARLALADIQADALNKLVEDLKAQGVEATGTIVDVSSSTAVDNWIASTVKHFGTLDGAANIAGIELGFTNIEDLKNETWDKMIAVNLTGVMYCVRAEIRVMKRGASIVNAASLAGIMGRPGIGAYACSKHGVVGLTKTVAKEVGAKGIRVNAIAPSVPSFAFIYNQANSITAVQLRRRCSIDSWQARHHRHQRPRPTPTQVCLSREKVRLKRLPRPSRFC